MKDWLDSKEFYELCQAYRHAPVHNNTLVLAAWEKMKRGILDNHLKEMLHGVDVWVKVTRVKH